MKKESLLFFVFFFIILVSIFYNQFSFCMKIPNKNQKKEEGVRGRNITVVEKKLKRIINVEEELRKTKEELRKTKEELRKSKIDFKENEEKYERYGELGMSEKWKKLFCMLINSLTLDFFADCCYFVD